MTTHIVEPGECLATIARDYGFRLWTTIYEAPENAQFRRKRPNPNVIWEGDQIVIPEKREKTEQRSTEQRHKFKLKAKKWVFRIEMKDENLDPIEDEPFLLRIEGSSPVGDKTGPGGLIEVPIPTQARYGTLRFMGEEFDLQFGMLDPVSRVKGVQQRLNNLGFMAGAVDGIVGPITRRAVYDFQRREPNLKPTGEIDDATRRRLLELHDNDGRCVATEEDMSSVETVPPEPETVEEPGEEPGEPVGDQTRNAEVEEWNDEPFGYEDY